MLHPETRLFTFAVVGDTHVKPESGDQSAPWKVNERATGRARFIAREIARYEPQFVIHLGDLVHPVPELPTFEEAVALTQQVFRQHHNRMHVLPGNHDIGDKPNPAMPAKGVRESWIAIHEKTYGPSYRVVDHDAIRVITLNTPVMNSGLPMEAAQRAWLEETLAASQGKRVFVFMHYPLFVLAPDEPSTYDNVDEPARSDLLALFARHEVEAVFAGHVHNIFYHRLAGTEYYVMPATSFVRQDYSEMFRIEAAPENGRDDAEKLGFALVDVHPDGHVVRYVSSYGRELSAAEAAAPVAPRLALKSAHQKLPGGSPLGVFMRHPWAEIVALPQNGPMDEFVRKRARNDYPLAALWRLGTRRLRVPLDDLIDPYARARMGDLVANGFRFTVSGFGVPKGAARQALVENRDLVDRFECVLPFDAIAAAKDDLATFRAAIGRPVLLARVATSADDVKVGSKIELFVSHGFRPDQLPEVERLIDLPVDGFVIRAGLGTDLVALSAELDAFATRTGALMDLHLRVAANNPAANVTDDGAILAAAAELYACALAHPAVAMFLDPFMDLDRGYFVRHGLVDRRCNLRAAGLAVEALAAFLPEGGTPPALSVTDSPEGRTLALKGTGFDALILLPKPGAALPLGPTAGPAHVVPLDAPFAIDGAIGDAPSGTLPTAADRPTLIVAADAKA
jgi:3',5'-cyclic AMP phosphodiesterase CpdA